MSSETVALPNHPSPNLEIKRWAGSAYPWRSVSGEPLPGEQASWDILCPDGRLSRSARRLALLVACVCVM